MLPRTTRKVLGWADGLTCITALDASCSRGGAPDGSTYEECFLTHEACDVAHSSTTVYSDRPPGFAWTEVCVATRADVR